MSEYRDNSNKENNSGKGKEVDGMNLAAITIILLRAAILQIECIQVKKGMCIIREIIKDHRC